jgi:hypothetical protein
VNTFKYVWQNTPILNRFNKQAMETIRAGGEEAATLHARSVIGGSMMVYAYTKFGENGITGNGPTDPALRKAWLETHQPYSVKVGDKWVSYRRMEPFASWLGLVADASEAAHEVEDDSTAQKAMAAVFVATVRNTYNKSWTTGLANFLDAMPTNGKDTEQSGRDISRFWNGIIAGFVPQALQQFNDDPYLREAKTLTDALRARVPGLSNDLPPKFNLAGEAVMKQGSLWNRNFSVAPVKSAQGKTLEDALLENDIPLTARSAKVANGIDLLDPRWEKNGKLPYIRFMELLREGGLRQRMEDFIKSDEWKDLSQGSKSYRGGERRDALFAIKDEAESEALDRLMAEYASTGLDVAYEGAKYELRTAARYGGRSEEERVRQEYGIPIPK